MSVLVLAAALVSIGVYGILVRRDLLGVLASVEVMMAGGLVMLVGLGTRTGWMGAGASTIEAIGVLVLVVIAAEAGVGFALLVNVAKRRGTTQTDELVEVRDE